MSHFFAKISAKFVPLRFKKKKQKKRNQHKKYYHLTGFVHTFHSLVSFYFAAIFFSIFSPAFLMQLYPSHFFFSTDKIMQIYAKMRRFIFFFSYSGRRATGNNSLSFVDSRPLIFLVN